MVGFVQVSLVMILGLVYYFPSADLRRFKERGRVVCPFISVLMYFVYAAFFFVVLFWFDSHFLNVFLLLFGVVVCFAGILLHFSSVTELGAFYSSHIENRSNHVLVTSGWYGRVRHPMYSAALVFFGGLTIMSVSLWVLAAYLVVWVYLLLRVRIEERHLVKLFGSRYRNYQRSVPALFPRLGF